MRASKDSESLDDDHNEDGCTLRDYSKFWKELINVLSAFPEFKDATTPIEIVSIINTLVGECSTQKRNVATLKKLMETKAEDIESRKRMEESLKERISSLNSIIGNYARYSGNIPTEQQSNRATQSNEQLNIQHNESYILAPNQEQLEQSEDCQKCEDLEKKCNILEQENAKYEMEFSCRHDAMINLQNSLQLAEVSEYPGEGDDKCKQLRMENKLLKEQLAKCHNITLEMQKKYLKPVEISETVTTLQNRCNSLELENKQLTIELSCKHDAELSLKQKDIQLLAYSELLKQLQNKYCISETEEDFNQLEIDKMELLNHDSDTTYADKLKEISGRVTEIQLEIKLLEEQFTSSTLQYCQSDVSEDVTQIQKRYDLLELKNKQLNDRLHELNEKLTENHIVHDMLSGNFSGATSQSLEDENKHDKTVILKQKDERGTYGVWFGRKRGPLTIRESKFYIARVNNSSPEAKALREGDFVINMNGVNVQQASTAMVNHILKSDVHGDLTLVVRNYIRGYNIKTISGSKSVGNDWGITLGVFVKEIYCNSFARKLGLHEYDEILKVNSHNVSQLNLTDIYKMMNKYVTFEIQRIEDEMFNLPDTIFNHIHQPTIDDYALNNSDESLYITRGNIHGVSYPDVNHPIQTESRYHSMSSSTLLSNSRSFAGMYVNLNTVELVINKKEYESFGWRLIGGNTTGIYIKEVEGHLPAFAAGIQEGWKLKQIDGYKLENVALCFAHDIINFLKKKKEVRVVFEKTDYEQYKENIDKKPHDCFHVRALVDYHGTRYSFKTGDVFCVKNSYFIKHDDGDAVEWEATASGQFGRNLDVVIPSQRARIIVIQEEPKYSWKKNTKKKTDFYYEILDDVDIVYSETDDLLTC